jgi:hypothetical protein
LHRPLFLCVRVVVFEPYVQQAVQSRRVAVRALGSVEQAQGFGSIDPRLVFFFRNKKEKDPSEIRKKKTSQKEKTSQK